MFEKHNNSIQDSLKNFAEKLQKITNTANDKSKFDEEFRQKLLRLETVSTDHRTTIDKNNKDLAETNRTLKQLIETLNNTNNQARENKEEINKIRQEIKTIKENPVTINNDTAEIITEVTNKVISTLKEVNMPTPEQTDQTQSLRKVLGAVDSLTVLLHGVHHDVDMLPDEFIRILADRANLTDKWNRLANMAISNIQF